MIQISSTHFTRVYIRRQGMDRNHHLSQQQSLGDDLSKYKNIPLFQDAQKDVKREEENQEMQVYYCKWIRYDEICFAMLCFAMLCYAMIWYDIWYDDMTWHDIWNGTTRHCEVWINSRIRGSKQGVTNLSQAQTIFVTFWNISTVLKSQLSH